MKKKDFKLYFLFSALLSLQTTLANSTQDIQLDNLPTSVEPKVCNNLFDICTDDLLHIFDDSYRRFNDSWIKISSNRNADMRITGSTTLLGLVNLPSTAQKSITNGLNVVIDSATGSIGIGTASTGSANGGIIAFSSGNVISGASVLPDTPRLLGFGNSAAETVDILGQSTLPSQAGGFSFPIPFNGTISNLQVSTDLFSVSATLLNSIGLQYDFTVFVSPSTPNNGTDHVSSSYVTTSLTASTAFGNLAGTTITASTFRSSTNINTGSISVNAGDRIGVRVRMLTTGNTITDGLLAAEVSQISFSASFNYIPN